MKARAKRRNEAFGFTSDEVDLEGADENRLREVLDIIGHGDQFQNIMESARSEIPMPALIGANMDLRRVPELPPAARGVKRLDPAKLKGWS
jgi:hypothetical protein